MNFKLSIVLLCLISLAVIASAKKGKNKKDKEDKESSGGKKSVRNLSTCFGEPIDLSSKLDLVDQCLETRFKEITETLNKENANDGKAAKKREKKKKKLSKKLRKKCMSECEWKSLGLISNETSGTNSSDITFSVDVEEFLELFPEAARGALNMSVSNCLNSSQTTPIMEGNNFNMGKQMCSRNKNLVKCLNKAVKKTCRRKNTPQVSPPKPTPSPTTPGAATTSPSKSSTSSAPITKVSTMEPPKTAQDDAEDDEEDKDDDDDKDEDDEEEGTTGNFKTSTPASSLPANMSQPVTK